LLSFGDGLGGARLKPEAEIAGLESVDAVDHANKICGGHPGLSKAGRPSWTRVSAWNFAKTEDHRAAWGAG
jgi:hypothetical protein